MTLFYHLYANIYCVTGEILCGMWLVYYYYFIFLGTKSNVFQRIIYYASHEYKVVSLEED